MRRDQGDDRARPQADARDRRARRGRGPDRRRGERLTPQADNPLIFGGEDHGSPPRRWSNVWEGWWPILHALHARLEGLDPDYRVRSVREREGGLAVDVEVAAEVRAEADAAMEEAARAAAATCECCGAAAELRTEPRGRWVKTLCDAHAAPDEVDRWTAVSGGRAGGRS